MKMNEYNTNPSRPLLTIVTSKQYIPQDGGIGWLVITEAEFLPLPVEQNKVRSVMRKRQTGKKEVKSKTQFK